MAVKTIILRGAGINKEGLAQAAITPGDLVEVRAGNADIRLQRHSTANRHAVPAFAREREVTGDGIETSYAANDTVLYTVLPPGAEVYVRVASGQVITRGNFLASNGDGTFRQHAAAATSAVPNEVILQSLQTLRGAGPATGTEAASATTAVVRCKAVVV